MRPASHYQTADRHPDKLQPSSARRRTTLGLSARRGRAARAATLLALFTAIVTIFNASASYAWPAVAPTAAPAAGRDFAPGFFSAALFQLPAFESIQTYAADCTTPKNDFRLGDTMCVKASVPFSFLVGRRSINIIGPSNVVRASTVVSDPSQTQTLSFTIPTTAQTVIGGETFDNRGTWRADLSTLSSSRRASADFDVSSAEAAEAAADLQIVSTVDGNTVPAGGSLSVTVYVLNAGPNSAENVVVTPPTGTGLALQSFSPVSGTDCGATCSVASLSSHGVAQFTAIYNVTAAAGSTILARSAVTSDTTDPRPTFDYVVDDQNPAPPANTNVYSLSLVVSSLDPNAACTLTCPANVVATANTTVGGQPGAFVNYGAASVEGECGVITNSPTSGSFFAVGTHTVTSSATGDSCTFTVKVLGTPAPTISCPSDKTATAASGADEATVAVGTPTFTASGGGTVVGVRGDSTIDEPKALTDPYPVGITSILWTVTDADGRTASCTQKIIVTSSTCGTDTENPTITAPDDITVGTGAGNTGCTITLDDELGQPEVNDNCTVSFTIAGVPAGNNFAPGTYTLTYTATDGAGHTASDTQVVTVVDNTAPIIAAPADATYTCLSEVPAANANQARGPVVGPDGQFVRDANDELIFSGPPFENCGPVNVSVSESNNGGAGSAANPRVITRTFTATDSAGNVASAVQTITVADGTAPTITAPADKVLYTGAGATSCGVTISDLNGTLGTATAADNCGGVTVTRGGGNTFPVGETIVTYTATDAAGNTAAATQKVTVIDNTPPAISCPVNINVGFNPAVNGAVVNYATPVGSDNCAGATTAQTTGLPSGATYPLGTTTNTFTVTDAAGNTASCSFKVTVALTSIVGVDGVSISGSSYIDSYDSNGGYPATKGSLTSVVSNSTSTLIGSGKVWGSVRSTQAGIIMSGASQITGDATAGTTVAKSGSAIVGGTITNNSPAPSVTLPAVPSCGPPYSSNAGISGSYSYNASTGDLNLSGVNVATLASGTYCFRNVTMSNSAQLNVSGPVVIKMTGTLNVGGAALVNHTSSIPGNLRVLSSYSGSNGVAFSNSGNVRLLVYAPQTGITISGAGPLFGTAVGKTITLSNSGTIHYDIRLLSVWPDLWPLIVGP